MAKIMFSRQDIEDLANRMEARAWSPLMIEMPELQRDSRSCVAILRWLVSQGIPVTHLELDIFNGAI
jgi:hypothetical protein